MVIDLKLSDTDKRMNVDRVMEKVKKKAAKVKAKVSIFPVLHILVRAASEN